MYWDFLRTSMWTGCSNGIGLWRAIAAITSSVSSSESTGAAFASSSSGGGAPALIAASIDAVRTYHEQKAEALTLLFRLILLLVCRQKNIVRL